jgi:catechol 2,3-dioxygenase-like lactoylglutathione lyase family enzyme
MRILGLTFAGSASEHRSEMSLFLRETLRLDQVAVDGVEADLFGLPDGSQFAVASPSGMGDTARSIGFLVDDLDEALVVLSNAGVRVGDTTENAGARYAHFRAPDDHLYELVERKDLAGNPVVRSRIQG